MQQNVFQILSEIQNLFLSVKISFLWLHFYNCTFLLQFLDGMVVYNTAQLHYE